MSGFYDSISAATLQNAAEGDALAQAQAAATSATAAATSLSTLNTTWHGILSTAPTTNIVTGSLYFDSSLALLRFYNGSAWVTAPAGPTGSTGATGPQGPTGTTGQTGAAGADGSNGSLALKERRAMLAPLVRQVRLDRRAFKVPLVRLVQTETAQAM